jgi:outer membrane protein assembly factor BamB
VSDAPTVPTPAPDMERSLAWPPPGEPLPTTAEPPRPRWLPPVTILLTLALAASALFLTDRVGQPPTSRTIDAFLPMDGAAWVERQQAKSRSVNTTDTVVTESAIITGSAVTGALTYTLATQLIGAAGSDLEVLERGRYWRTTTTVPARSATEAQHIRVYNVVADLSLMVESGPRGAFVYRPNLVELPQDVAPGRTWGSSGSAGGSVSYTSSFRAAEAADGCLAVTGNITYTATHIESIARELRRTWCPGQGLVALSEDGGGERLELSRLPDPPGPPGIETSDAPSTWAPSQWSKHSLASTSVDPTFGEGEVSGTPSALLAQTRSRVLLRGTTSGQDVVGLTRASATTWQTRWRVHPGATILTLAAFGDAFVATTSARTVVGYGADGSRRWRTDLDEVVTAPPVRASVTDLVLVTMGGEVIVLEIATGKQRWRVKPGSDVGVGPAVADGKVIVADRGGNLIALSLTTGAEEWRTESGEVTALAGGSGQVFVVGPTDVDSFDVTDGERVWRYGVPNSASSPVALSDGVVVLTNGGAQALDSAGRTRWFRPGVYGLTAAGGHLICWGRGKAEVLDSSSTVVTTFAIPEQTLANPHRFLADADGVSLLDSSWSFTRWDRG